MREVPPRQAVPAGEFSFKQEAVMAKRKAAGGSKKKSTRKSKKKGADKEVPRLDMVDPSLDSLSSDMGMRSQDDYVVEGPFVPYLPLQYMFATNILPLHRVFLVTGPESSGKTALCLEFARMVMNAGGPVFYWDTENKFSDTLNESLFHDVPNWKSLWKYKECEVMDTWTQGIIKLCRGLRGQKYRFPVMIIVDSFMGVLTQDHLDKVFTQGDVASRSYSEESLKASKLMRFLSGVLPHVPVVCFFTNHILTNLGEMHDKGRKPGGKSQCYRCVSELKLNKLSDKSLKRNGFRVKAVLAKSGTGPDDRKIEVRFTWKGVDGVQVSSWNWMRATCDMLSSMDAEELGDVVKVEYGASGRWYCAQASDKQMYPEDLGREIHNNEQLMSSIQKQLCIRKRAVLGKEWSDFDLGGLNTEEEKASSADEDDFDSMDDMLETLEDE